MPIYEIQGKDGRIYELPGPPGLSREQVIAAVLERAPEAGLPRQEESIIEKIPVVGGAVSAVTDLPLNLVSGLANTGKTFTDLFGADNFASDALESLGQGAESLTSRSSREDQALSAKELEEAEGVWEALKAAGKTIARSPLDTTAELLGSALPYAGAAVAGGVPAALAAGAVSGAGMIKGDIYDATYNRAIEAGLSEEQADAIADQAQAYSGENLDMIGLGATIGAVASATGVTPRLAQMLGRKAATDVIETAAARAAGKGFVRRTGEATIAEAVPEGLQASQEQYAKNLAQQRAGFETDPTKGVLEQGIYEGTLAGFLGGGLGMFDKGPAEQGPSAEELAEANPEVIDVVTKTFANDGELDDTQRARATEMASRLMLTGGVDFETAVGQAREAVLLETEQAAKRAKGERAGVDTGPDESGVPSIDEEVGRAGPAAEVAEPKLARVGDAGAVSGEPAVGEGGGEPSLAPILNPKLRMEERVDLARELVLGAVKADPTLEGLPVKTYGNVIRQIAQNAARGTLLDVGTVLRDVAQAAPITKAPKISEPEDVEVTWDNIKPGQQVTLYRGENAENTKGGGWWTTSKAKAEKYGKVQSVTLPAEVIGKFAAQGHGGKDEFVFDKKLPSELAVEQTKTVADTTSEDVSEGTQATVAKAAPVATPSLEGIPVTQLPPGRARGLAARKDRDIMSRDEVGGPEDVAGKLTTAQEAQVNLLNTEIDAARKRREISDFERSQLVDMLRTPQGLVDAASLMRTDPVEAMALRAKADPTWRAATDLQAEIDRLTKEGRSIRTRELQLQKSTGLTLDEAKEQKKLTPEHRRLMKEIKDVSERTKRAADELMSAKQKIYQKVKIALAAKRSKRKKRVDQIKADLQSGKINEARYRVLMSEARPEPARYRRAEPQAAGIGLGRMNEIVQDIVGRMRLAISPKLVQSVEDLPSTLRKEMEDAGRLDASGVFKGNDVYLIADNMASEDTVIPTLFHETLGHLGLRRLFREGLDANLVEMYNSNDKVRKATDKWMAENPDQYAADEDPLARAVEEVFAEASEGGPVYASMLDKLTRYVREFMRKVFGVDMKLTDGEINTLLAMAHEQVIEDTEGELGTGSANAVYSRKARKDEAEGRKDAYETEAESNKYLEEVQTSTDRIDEESYKGGMKALGKAITTHNAKRVLKGLTPKRIWQRFIPGEGLDALPTDATLDYAETLLGVDNVKELRTAVDAMEKLNGNRATIRRTLSQLIIDLRKYIEENGSNVLGDGLFFADRYNMDLTKFKEGMTKAEAYATDAVWNYYTKRLKEPDLDKKQAANFKKKLEKREAQIRDGLKAYDALSKTRNGMALYKRIGQMHKDMYETRRYLMRKHLESLKDAGVSPEAINKLLAAYSLQFEKINERKASPDKEDAHDEYGEVPLGLFHRQYFPKRRYGNYWLRIKKTKFGEPILQFFETRAERDEALDEAVRTSGVKPKESGSQFYYEVGNNVEMDLNDMDGVNTNTAFNKALNVISEIDPENFTEATKTKLQKDVYQLFLMSTPEGSARKQFIKSKGRLGWNADLLRTVGVTAEEYASDISRLRYGPEIDGALKAFADRLNLDPKTAKDVKSDSEGKKTKEGEIAQLSTEQKMIARDFRNNIQRRIMGTMEPQTESLLNKIVPGINQLAYITFLTGPATALIQNTALPMRVAPHLWGKYGMAATSKAMGRYMNVFSNMPKRMGKNAETRKSFRIATLREAPGVKNVAHRAEALKWATDRGLTLPLSEFTMHEERTPASAAQGKTKRIIQATYDGMTYLLDTMEQFTREVAFMAAYDLEYEKLAGSKLSEDARRETARQSARQVIGYTLGDYSNLNRPLLFKSSELAKAFFLFKMYSAITTRFFVTNSKALFKDIFSVERGWKPAEARAARAAASKEMFGVLSMSFLFGGITTLPLYTMGMTLLQMLQDATDDDDDRRQRMKDSPLTADSVEMQFRYDWLPEKFGTPLVKGKGGNDYTMADIILNGPISETSGWNFGSRVSLDLASLWYRSPKDAETFRTTIYNGLVENIPGASASLSVVDMAEGVAKGDVYGGIMKAVPAILRGPMKAYELKTEGVRTQTGKIKLASDELSDMDAVGAFLGFNPTEVAKLQRRNRDITGRIKDLDKTQKELTGAFNEAVRRIANGDPDGRAEARKAFENIIEYNQKIGNPYFMITDEKVMRSLRGSFSKDKYDIAGMELNAVGSHYTRELLNRQKTPRE
jgi:hypothetical protein